MNYAVTIERISISTFYVDADSKQEAELKGYEQAINDDWSRDFAEYKPISVIEQKLPF